MTKMMTALQHYRSKPGPRRPPEEIFPALQAQNASLAGFQPGETATVRDLLYGAMLPSGAECCEALAREVSGSEEAFAARMNQKAAELGMTATHFCNPTGLHDPEHVSTVRDMARLTEAALQNETFRKLFTTERYTVPATNCHPQGFTMHSTLLSQLDGTELHRGRILGGKTRPHRGGRALPCQSGRGEGQGIHSGHGRGRGKPQHRALPHRGCRNGLPPCEPGGLNRGADALPFSVPGFVVQWNKTNHRTGEPSCSRIHRSISAAAPILPAPRPCLPGTRRFRLPARAARRLRRGGGYRAVGL